MTTASRRADALSDVEMVGYKLRSRKASDTPAPAKTMTSWNKPNGISVSHCEEVEGSQSASRWLVQHGTDGRDDPDGRRVTVQRDELDGRPFAALNGGPQFTFSEAVSLQLFVHDQAELDRLWDGLLADGGQESQCGWLKDRYGFSWQTVPVKMGEWMTGPNADAVFKTMMPMRKLDMAALEAASNGSAPVS